MFRSKAIVGLIRPMRDLAVTRNRLHAAAHESQLRGHLDKQMGSHQAAKDVKGLRRAHGKDKIGDLVRMLVGIGDSKEAVYGALDSWVAEEQEFPIGRLKTALIMLERKQRWHEVVQVIKWMLSKGQGATVVTYGQLIRALDMDHRAEEASKLWVKKLSRDVESVPWKVCDIMILVYYRNERWGELVKLFKDLESHGRKPRDRSVVEKVAESYEKLGLVEEKGRVLEKYKSLFSKTRGRGERSKTEAAT